MCRESIVAAPLQLSVLIHRVFTRQKLADPLEDTVARRSRGSEEEQLIQPFFIHTRRDHPAVKDRLDLGAEHDPVGIGVIKQRLDADSVTTEKEPARVLLIYRERENPVELFGARFFIVAVRLEQYLCIAARAESEARGFQLLPQLSGIVQLAVIDDGVLFTLIQGAHRLLTVLGVDDAQPTMQQRRVTADVLAVFIGSPPFQTLRHLLQFIHLFFKIGCVIQPACDSAHMLPPFKMSLRGARHACQPRGNLNRIILSVTLF